MVTTSFEEEQLKKILAGIYTPQEQKIAIYPEVYKKRVIVIAGPTGAGKTDLSLMLASVLGGEIISADSLQVYRGMDIGTAKVTLQERAKVPHHLIDIRDISENFNVVDFYHEARLCCEGICARDRTPILVGGSGFYLHVFLYGPPPGPSSVPEVRKRLEEEMEKRGPDRMYEELRERDPEYAETITRHDRSKIIRALEIITLTGDKVSQLPWQSSSLPIDYDFRCWFVYRSRDSIYTRINDRCESMLKEGFMEEVIDLEEKGLGENTSASNAIGYRQCLNFLKTERSEEDYSNCISEFKKQSRRYAKRQFTWFRRKSIFRWLDLEIHDKEIAVDIIAQDYLRDEPI